MAQAILAQEHCHWPSSFATAHLVWGLFVCLLAFAATTIHVGSVFQKRRRTALALQACCWLCLSIGWSTCGQGLAPPRQARSAGGANQGTAPAYLSETAPAPEPGCRGRHLRPAGACEGQGQGRQRYGNCTARSTGLSAPQMLRWLAMQGLRHTRRVLERTRSSGHGDDAGSSWLRFH